MSMLPDTVAFLREVGGEWRSPDEIRTIPPRDVGNESTKIAWWNIEDDSTREVRRFDFAITKGTVFTGALCSEYEWITIFDCWA